MSRTPEDFSHKATSGDLLEPIARTQVASTVWQPRRLKRTLLLCLVSAVLGGAVAVRITEEVSSWSSEADAQDSLPPAYAYGTPQVGTPAPPAGTLAPVAVPGARPARPDLLPEERVNTWVYEQTNRAVVNIATRSADPASFFYGEGVSEGAGSGVVLDRQGHILTNYHVVEDARVVQVSLFDGSAYMARAVGLDPATDTAVLKIDAPAEVLFPVTLGDSSQLLVGQRVFAIGNPFALERTLTTGIISSLNRSLPSRKAYRMIKQVIQVDAAINPGNSGGPLLDTSGRMIGLNTAIASRTGQNTGVGFAIPVNTIARVVPELIQSGRVVRPDIGITQVYETEDGLMIAQLDPDGPAAAAGLQGPEVVRERRRQGMLAWTQVYVDRSAADTIVGVDGEPTPTAEDFITLIESKTPGDEIVINIIRGGKPYNVRVTLDAEE